MAIFTINWRNKLLSQLIVFKGPKAYAMNELDISKRLRSISDLEWISISKKCYTHIDLKIGGKLKFGAHNEQRLGMPAYDYYFGNALKVIYEHSWEWQYEKYGLAEQLVRIIDSMISNEVRKYKVERSNDKQLPLLVEANEFDDLADDDAFELISDAENFNQYSHALQKACDGNTQYQNFVRLKFDGKSYDEIAQILDCTVQDAYRLMENIGKKARRNLKS